MPSALEEVSRHFRFTGPMSREGASEDDGAISDGRSHKRKNGGAPSTQHFDFLHRSAERWRARRRCSFSRRAAPSWPRPPRIPPSTASSGCRVNEVGGDPRRFGISVAAFHHATRDRARSGRAPGWRRRRTTPSGARTPGSGWRCVRNAAPKGQRDRPLAARHRLGIAGVEPDRPRPDQRLVEQVFDIAVGYRAAVDFTAPRAVDAQPAGDALPPAARHFRQHRQPDPRILAALGVVRRGRQHRVRPGLRPLSRRVVKRRDR